MCLSSWTRNHELLSIQTQTITTARFLRCQVGSCSAFPPSGFNIFNPYQQGIFYFHVKATSRKVNSLHCAVPQTFTEIIYLSAWSRMPYKQYLPACPDYSGVRPFLDVIKAIRELACMAGIRQKHFTTSTKHATARQPC